MSGTAEVTTSSRGRRNSTGNTRKGKGAKSYKKPTTSLYQHTTNRILEGLKKDSLPWVKPWAVVLPFNGAKHNRYSGINVFNLLDAAEEKEFKNPRWATWKQIKDLGGTILKDQTKKYTWVYKAGQFDAKQKDEHGKVLFDGEGKVLTQQKNYLKGYMVYNVEQTEGLPAELYVLPETRNTDERLEDIEAFIKGLGIPVKETNGDRAYFSKGLKGFGTVKKPKITLPAFENFNDASEYYATVFHEQAHWTGTEPQLNRDCYSKYHDDKKERAKEELVAELTASYLCAYFGIQAHAQDTSYIASWIQNLEDNEKTIFEAARQAQTAADYLLEQAGIAIKGKYQEEPEESA